MKGASEKYAKADLVIQHGRIIKNKTGKAGGFVPIPDGCYELRKL